ncbi:MAG TPA: hypothetical protein VNC50_14275, partial [Planctomycetia bacterium]|nr:hypothetical protein [Planctomycetia bacterium]
LMVVDTSNHRRVDHLWGASGPIRTYEDPSAGSARLEISLLSLALRIAYGGASAFWFVVLGLLVAIPLGLRLRRRFLRRARVSSPT